METTANNPTAQNDDILFGYEELRHIVRHAAKFACPENYRRMDDLLYEAVEAGAAEWGNYLPQLTAETKQEIIDSIRADYPREAEAASADMDPAEYINTLLFPAARIAARAEGHQHFIRD